MTHFEATTRSSAPCAAAWRLVETQQRAKNWMFHSQQLEPGTTRREPSDGSMDLELHWSVVKLRIPINLCCISKLFFIPHGLQISMAWRSLLKKRRTHWIGRTKKRPSSSATKPLRRTLLGHFRIPSGPNDASPWAKWEISASFPCIGLHPMNLEPLPLMAFLAETTVSQDYIPPAKLLHWMHCITYTMSTKQERTGMIYKEMWKDPQYLLFSRKGSPQDHAILLCSVLLGMSRDAYVVKGTIQVPTAMSKPKLVEHVWVMTREDGGWVTFWEPSTREFYHLPNRWVETKKKVLAEPKVQKTNEEDDEEEDEDRIGHSRLHQPWGYLCPGEKPVAQKRAL